MDKTTNSMPLNSSIDIAFEIVKTEYDHCVVRSNKLDNKVYITFTISSFLFTMILELIKSSVELLCNFKIYTLSSLLTMVFMVLLIFTIIFYFYLIFMLISLLKSISTARIDPIVVTDFDIQTKDPLVVSRFICGKYISCIYDTRIKLDERNLKLNKCLDCLKLTLFLSFLLVCCSNL